MTVYNIPATLFPLFTARPVIVRAADATALRAVLGEQVPAGLAFVQLTTLDSDLAPLADWGEGLPIDLVMTDPVAQLHLLYRCAPLAARHPVRLTVPWLPGLGPAVKLAAALGFAVRLAGARPAPGVIEEARQALDAYLHNPTFAQPVEPFHGLLLAFLHDSPVDLWALLECDPQQTCLLDEQGVVLPDQGPTSVTAWRDALTAADAECRRCPWFAACNGYFKWPRGDYACDGVKGLFAEVAAAAAELRRDLAAQAAAGG
jgi:hypothetical protein